MPIAQVVLLILAAVAFFVGAVVAWTKPATTPPRAWWPLSLAYVGLLLWSVADLLALLGIG